MSNATDEPGFTSGCTADARTVARVERRIEMLIDEEKDWSWNYTDMMGILKEKK